MSSLHEVVLPYDSPVDQVEAADPADPTAQIDGLVEKGPVEASVAAALASEGPENDNEERRRAWNQLALEAQVGDIDSMNSLIESCQRLARSIIRNNDYYLRGAERDDLCQEALIGALDAIERFDLSRGDNFYKLAMIAMRRRMWTAIKMASCHKNEVLSSAVSLDAEPCDRSPKHEVIPNGQPGPEAIVLSKEGIARFLSIYHNELTTLEREALRLFMRGRSYEDIAGTIERVPEITTTKKAITTKTVDNALIRARRKLVLGR